MYTILTLLFLAVAGANSGAQAQRFLNVHGATDMAAIARVIEAFERHHPDIRVRYREYNTNDLFNHVIAHCEHRACETDVVISSAMDLQVSLVNQGLAHRFDPGTPVAMAWRSELFGFTEEPIAIVFNRAAFGERALPRNHAELAGMIRDQSRFFEGRIGTYDIRRSGVGYLLATQDGILDYRNFRLIESLGRAGTRVFCCTSEMLDATASGDLVLSYNVIGSYALSRVKNDPRLGVHFMEDYNLVLARTALIPNTTPNKADAETFVSFLVSPQGQATISRVSTLTAGVDFAPSPDDVAHALGSKRLIPIRLGVALLTYLDRQKRRSFIASWEAAMLMGPLIP